MKILVIGGTRFFGKELVSKLVAQGHEVTIVSRGNQDISGSSRVAHIKADRGELEGPLRNLGTHWDVVYDQICYCSEDAAATLRAINGRADKLIIASSEAVYEDGLNKRETDFNPQIFPYKMGPRSRFSYPDGKRHAEAFLSQNANLPIIAARIPFVFGIEDYTQRLENLIKAIAQRMPICAPSLDAHLSMIHSSDIAEALCALKDVNHDGPINIAPKVPISTRYLLDQIETTVGEKALLSDTSESGLVSDFLITTNRTIDPARLETLGMEIRAIGTWLPPLITDIFTRIRF